MFASFWMWSMGAALGMGAAIVVGAAAAAVLLTVLGQRSAAARSTASSASSPPPAPQGTGPFTVPSRSRADLYLNILLYAGGLLIVAAIGSFLLTATSTGTRIAFVWGVAVLFYLCGLLLHTAVRRLRPVGVAFTGTGLAVLPFAGIALGGWQVTSAGTSWLLTSLAGAALYLLAALLLGSRVISWLGVGYLFSSVLAAVSFATTEIAWHLAVITVVSTIAQAVLLAVPSPSGRSRLLYSSARHLSTYLPLAAVAALAFINPSAADVAVIGAATTLHLVVMRAGTRSPVYSAGLRLSVPATLLAGLRWAGNDSGLAPLPALGLLLAAALFASGLVIAALASASLRARGDSPESTRLFRIADWTWLLAGLGSMMLAAGLTRFDADAGLFRLPPHSLTQLGFTLALLGLTVVAALLFARRHRSLLLVVAAGIVLPLIPFAFWGASIVHDESGIGAPLSFIVLALAPVLGHRAISSPLATPITASFAGAYSGIGAVWLLSAPQPHGWALPVAVIALSFAITSAGVLLARTAHFAWVWPLLLGIVLPVALTRAGGPGTLADTMIACTILGVAVAGACADAVLLWALRRGAASLPAHIASLALRAPEILLLGFAGLSLANEPGWLAVAAIGAVLLGAARAAAMLHASRRATSGRIHPLALALAPASLAQILVLSWSPTDPLNGPVIGAAMLLATLALAGFSLGFRIGWLFYLLIPAIYFTAQPFAQAFLEASSARGVLLFWLCWAAYYGISWANRLLERNGQIPPGHRTVLVPAAGPAVASPPSPSPGTPPPPAGAAPPSGDGFGATSAHAPRPWATSAAPPSSYDSATPPGPLFQPPFQQHPHTPPQGSVPPPPQHGAPGHRPSPADPTSPQYFGAPPHPAGVPRHADTSWDPGHLAAAPAPRPAPPAVQRVRMTLAPASLRSPRTLSMYIAAAISLALAGVASFGLPADAEAIHSLPQLIAGLTFTGVALMVGLEGLPQGHRGVRPQLLEPASYVLAIGLSFVLNGLFSIPFYLAVHLLLAPAFVSAMILGRAAVRRRQWSVSVDVRWIGAMVLLTILGMFIVFADPGSGWKSLVFLIDHLAMLVVGGLIGRPLLLWWGLGFASAAVVFGLRNLLWLALLVMGLIIILVVVWQLLRRKPQQEAPPGQGPQSPQPPTPQWRSPGTVPPPARPVSSGPVAAPPAHASTPPDDWAPQPRSRAQPGVAVPPLPPRPPELGSHDSGPGV